MTKPLLDIQQLTCIRQDRILFEALSFAVNAGDIIQIEGPNGAGKTSLLRILAGLTQPYDGKVLFEGVNINQSTDSYHQALLYLGHTPGVKHELTALENLNFNLAMANCDADAEQTLAQVNLMGFEYELASHLSAGQHRRIALAQLFVSTAKVWILDEPLTAIDKQGVKQLEQLFVAHAERGGCVILTTHQDLMIDYAKFSKFSLSYRF